MTEISAKINLKNIVEQSRIWGTQLLAMKKVASFLDKMSITTTKHALQVGHVLLNKGWKNETMEYNHNGVYGRLACAAVLHSKDLDVSKVTNDRFSQYIHPNIILILKELWKVQIIVWEDNFKLAQSSGKINKKAVYCFGGRSNSGYGYVDLDLHNIIDFRNCTPAPLKKSIYLVLKGAKPWDIDIDM